MDKRIVLFLKQIKYKKNVNQCWEWKGKTYPNGYGYFHIDKKTRSTHQISFEIFYHKIPNDLIVMHSCDNRLCVNPNHLSLGTMKDNLQDMAKKNRQWQQKKTHCKNGHKFTKENTGFKKPNNKHRFCKACDKNFRKSTERKEWQRKYAEKKYGTAEYLAYWKAKYKIRSQQPGFKEKRSAYHKKYYLEKLKLKKQEMKLNENS